MTRDEVEALIEHVEATFPGNFPRPGMVTAWLRYLGPVSMEEALAAVDALVMQGRESAGIGLIMTEVRAARTFRVEHAAIDYRPDPEAPPQVQVAELRRVIAEIAGGTGDGRADFLRRPRRALERIDRVAGRRAIAAGTVRADVPQAAVAAIEAVRPVRSPQIEAAYPRARRVLAGLPDKGEAVLAAALAQKGEDCDIVELVVVAAGLAGSSAA